MEKKPINKIFTRLIRDEPETCADMGWNCCDCGGENCGCAYCWSCHACDNCKNDIEPCELLESIK